ncbi:MAG: hypothetical protein ACPGJV_12935 [Bacteriovoracaceae bacterium]
MNSNLRNEILIESDSIRELIKESLVYFENSLPAFFLMAICIHMILSKPSSEFLTKGFLAILALIVIENSYFEAIDASIDLANERLKSKANDNLILKGMILENNLTNRNFTGYSLEGSKTTFKNLISNPSSILKFIKYNLLSFPVNEILSIVLHLVTQLCFIANKAVFSIMYYLGYGLFGIPCILFLFPGMEGSLKGAILNFVTCLVAPHILVFLIVLITDEMKLNVTTGKIIGGSVEGTALLIVLTVLIAIVPVLSYKLVTGSGISYVSSLVSTATIGNILNGAKTLSGFNAIKKNGFFKSLTKGFESSSNKSRLSNPGDSKPNLFERVRTKGLFTKSKINKNEANNPPHTEKTVKGDSFTMKEPSIVSSSYPGGVKFKINGFEPRSTLSENKVNNGLKKISFSMSQNVNNNKSTNASSHVPMFNLNQKIDRSSLNTKSRKLTSRKIIKESNSGQLRKPRKALKKTKQ